MYALSKNERENIKEGISLTFSNLSVRSPLDY